MAALHSHACLGLRELAVSYAGKLSSSHAVPLASFEARGILANVNGRVAKAVCRA